jgi:enoyl-[acyl-carrier-protein] reductase (NADH)
VANSLKALIGKVDQIVVSIARAAEKSARKEFFETYEEWFGLTENQFGNGFEASKNGQRAWKHN